ncbi:MAG: hypothetical protein M1830_000582 [Pleopsidium flavum]|nr:MAG: hypothetical protein M1830_000582 [Pleopsidium flavum]
MAIDFSPLSRFLMVATHLRVTSPPTQIHSGSTSQRISVVRNCFGRHKHQADDIQAKIQAVNRNLYLLPNIDMQVSQLPNAIETAVVSRFEQYGRQMEQLKNEFQLGASQNSSEMQQLVILQTIKAEISPIFN